MTTTITELSQGVLKFFSEKLPSSTSATPGDVILIFDSLGTPLQPGEFFGTGTATAQDLLGHQRAAQLADQIPAGNALALGWFLPRSGSRVSRWYETIVDSSAHSTSDLAGIEAFEKRKYEARRALDQNRQVVISGTVLGEQGGTVPAAGVHDSYYSTSMSPLDWYLDTSASWSTYSLASSGTSMPPNLTPLPLRPLDFKLRMAEVPSLATTRFIQEATVSEQLPVLAQEGLQEPLLVDKSELTIANISPLLKNFQRELPIKLTEIASTQFTADKDKILRAVNEGNVTSEPHIAILDLAQPIDNTVLTSVPSTAIGSKLLLNAAINPNLDSLIIQPGIDFSAVLDREDVVSDTTTKPPTSTNFSVSFEYCMVRFDRPWWDDVFISSRGWRLPGYEPGQISTGKVDGAYGNLTLITVGMLVVRRLTISAQWSDEDANALASSTSLGPFCIAGGTFDTNTGKLQRDGLQAIAWLCQVPPMLPPNP